MEKYAKVNVFSRVSDELTSQAAIFLCAVFSAAILLFSLRRPERIPIIYPYAVSVVFVSRIFSGAPASSFFLSLFTMASVVGAIISSPSNKAVFLATLILCWAVFVVMFGYDRLSDSLWAECTERVERSEIKLNATRVLAAGAETACEALSARIENYSRLADFLRFMGQFTDVGSFFAALVDNSEKYLGAAARLSFSASAPSFVRAAPGPAAATFFISKDSTKFAAPFLAEIPDRAWASVDRAPEKFTDDDARFVSMALDFARAAAMNVMLYEETQRLSILDGLTGLYLRGYFMERLDEEFALARGHGMKLAFAMLDVDNFKLINDNHGHGTGDEILKGIAYILKHRMRETDVVGRYGGEEFAVVMPGASADDAFAVMEDVRRAVAREKFFVESGARVHATVSAGIAAMDPAVAAPAGLIRLADEALYDAKNSGRNAVRLRPLPSVGGGA